MKKLDKIFEEAAKEIKKIEKGYANHPSDPGGKTRWGISEWLARAYKYDGKMKNLPWKKAKEIYYKEYWHRNKYNKIKNRRIAKEVLEQAINLPTIVFKSRKVLKANYHLQKAYCLASDEEIAVDGIIGNETLEAVNNCPEIIQLFNILNGYQAKHYLEIVETHPELEDFVNGWFNKRIEIRKV